jgi:hypothetical protein
MEPHGTIVNCRWAGTRGALVRSNEYYVVIRPFNDTAPNQDCKTNLSPDDPITLPKRCWVQDKP